MAFVPYHFSWKLYHRIMVDLHKDIYHLTGASAIASEETVQKLWSGYGEIKRYELAGGNFNSVIVKHIQWPDAGDHPRGWNTPLSHQRKLKSYQVEKHWYQEFSKRTNKSCKVPDLLQSVNIESGLLLILEDLDQSGFELRYDPAIVRLEQVKSVLSWLAHFHATFMGYLPNGLWPIGTYWHLDTRPEEWQEMQNSDLKLAAKAIDATLNSASFQTFVHGDAKLANFCFGKDHQVAAVDFQYIGKGCGMKDVAYFLSSCFEESACERYESGLLNHYFGALKSSLNAEIDFEALQEEWRKLYAFAWADFYRFLDGWSPGHWKMHGYSKRITQQVLDELNQNEA